MIESLIFAFLATLGYSVLFNVPKKHIAPAAFGGAIGWMGFLFIGMHGAGSVTAAFVGATIVAIWGEILSVRVKEIVTIFFIPGIIPLVPGSGMYYTMLALIQGDFTEAAVTGSETLFVAGAIASALITVSSISRVIRGRKIMA